MTGKTHLAVGAAASLCLARPGNLREMVLCIGTAAVGSVISDIDVTTSESRSALNRITLLTGAAAVLTGAAEMWWDLGIIRNFDRESNVFRLIIGFAAFLLVCTFGKNQPHRSFMHSFAGVAALTGILALIYPAVVPYFSVAMLSHIVIDLLNHRRVRLLYPLKWGVCLKLCSSDGIINRNMFLAGCGVSFVAVAVLISGYFAGDGGIPFL